MTDALSHPELLARSSTTRLHFEENSRLSTERRIPGNFREQNAVLHNRSTPRYFSSSRKALLFATPGIMQMSLNFGQVLRALPVDRSLRNGLLGLHVQLESLCKAEHSASTPWITSNRPGVLNAMASYTVLLARRTHARRHSSPRSTERVALRLSLPKGDRTTNSLLGARAAATCVPHTFLQLCRPGATVWSQHASEVALPSVDGVRSFPTHNIQDQVPRGVLE